MERVARRRDRRFLVAGDGELTDQSMHGGQNFGRARLDSGRRHRERPGRYREYPHETAGSHRGQLHGLRRVRGADLRPRLHENEEAARDDQAGSAVVHESAGVHVLPALLAAERRQDGKRLSEFHQ